MLEQSHGPHCGARQYIRVLQLLAEHPVDRVQRAIAGGAAEADLIAQRVQRLAQRTQALDRREAPSQLAQYQVPREDLTRFDEHLCTGEPAYV